MTGDQIQGDKIGGDKVAGDKYVILPASVKGPPIQLPRRAEYFQGREAEIGELLAGLRPGSSIALYGPGGIGKTAVAAEALWRICPDNQPPPLFRDGIIFYTFYGQKSVDAAMAHVLRSVGIDEKGSLADLTRMALGGKALLLVLDGAEEADALQRILDAAGSCGVLITSRRQEDVRGLGIKIGKLPLASSDMLLRKWGGEQAVAGGSVQEICELVGNLPLAVALAGQYLAASKETAEEYLEWVRSSPLEALDFGQRRGRSVPVLLAKSSAQVSDMARQALSVTGVLELAPFGVEAVAAAL